MDRIKTAALIPLVVFPSAAAVAIFIGWLLHQVQSFVAKPLESSVGPQVASLVTPAFALLLVCLVTAAGFVAAYRFGEQSQTNPDEH